MYNTNDYFSEDKRAYLFFSFHSSAIIYYYSIYAFFFLLYTNSNIIMICTRLILIIIIPTQNPWFLKYENSSGVYRRRDIVTLLFYVYFVYYNKLSNTKHTIWYDNMYFNTNWNSMRIFWNQNLPKYIRRRDFNLLYTIVICCTWFAIRYQTLYR